MLVLSFVWEAQSMGSAVLVQATDEMDDGEAGEAELRTQLAYERARMAVLRAELAAERATAVRLKVEAAGMRGQLEEMQEHLERMRGEVAEAHATVTKAMEMLAAARPPAPPMWVKAGMPPQLRVVR